MSRKTPLTLCSETHKRMRFLLLTLILLLSATPATALADNWPQWRGPTGDGVSTAKDLPLQWNTKSNVRWTCELPPWGSSTPVAWGDSIFLTTHVDNKTLSLLCIDKKNGTVSWNHAVGNGGAELGTVPGNKRGSAVFHRDHNLASPSVTTDGTVVIAHFGNGDLLATNFDGKELWRRNLVKDHGPFTTWWGRANSPVLHKNLVISVCIQDSCADVLKTPAPNYVVAHDKMTGKQVWKTARTTGLKRAFGDSYITPIFRKVGDQIELVVAGGSWLDGYDPDSGKRLWQVPGLRGFELARNPVTSGDLILVAQGKSRALNAIRPRGKGKLGLDTLVWSYGHCRWDASSPVVWQDRVYMVDNGGIVNCIDAKSGERIWKQRLKGTYRSSPIAADGHIYFQNTTGLTTVLKAGDTFKVVAQNQLEDETLASPIISGKNLFIRGKKRLYCIGK
jgi:outer membrane protein assembly factor BamB